MTTLITNTALIATSPLRADALAIAEAGLAAIETGAVIRTVVSLSGDMLSIGAERYDLRAYERLIVAGVGKCSLDAARALEEMLGGRISDGLVLDVRCDPSLTYIKSCEGTHPMPSDTNITHTRELLELLEEAGEHDLVLFIVSGGGSTLLCSPKNGICDDEKHLLEKLFAAGATIADINVVRKHLSLARGGHIAAAAYPATLVAFVFSDVPGDDIGTIASGPTVRDSTTVADARAIIARFGLTDALDVSLLMETPKEETYFSKTRTFLALTNKTALDAMQREASMRDYNAQIVTTTLSGEARVLAGEMLATLHHAPEKSVFLYGGETTISEASGIFSGMGGRNQELALAALEGIREHELILTFASDGHDNTEHAGAIADRETLEAAAHAKENILARLTVHDSFPFFDRVGAALVTGYTGSNVSDLIITMKGDGM